MALWVWQYQRRISLKSSPQARVSRSVHQEPTRYFVRRHWPPGLLRGAASSASGVDGGEEDTTTHHSENLKCLMECKLEEHLQAMVLF